MENREQDGLKALGKKTEYLTDYTPEVLEAFENKHCENDYWVRFNCPEFTALCPITGQPDFAEIRINYLPDKRMVESNTLYLVIKEFNSPKGYLGADKISAVDCGYVFEDLVRRFNESYGEEAGAHFTSRDIIYLMTDILLADTQFNGQNITVYDMTMGTSQMLSCMQERISALDSEAEVTCFGQEFNPSTFAIAKADMMIRGGDPNNMRFGDTLYAIMLFFACCLISYDCHASH